MPKGVEHAFACWYSVHRNLVPDSVMPKGVEHA